VQITVTCLREFRKQKLAFVQYHFYYGLQKRPKAPCLLLFPKFSQVKLSAHDCKNKFRPQKPKDFRVETKGQIDLN
jgi:hypothetical protein